MSNKKAKEETNEKQAFGGIQANERREELTARYMKPEKDQLYYFVPCGFGEIVIDEKRIEVVKGFATENGKDDFAAIWGQSVVLNTIKKDLETGKTVLGETVYDITYKGQVGEGADAYKSFEIGRYGKVTTPYPEMD